MNRARREAGEPRASGIFVVGAFDSGVELLGEAISLLGLPHLVDPGDAAGMQQLGTFNERLLGAAGGSGGDPPAAAPFDLVHTLSPWIDEARRKAEPHGEAPGAWVWADARLSFLTPFWTEALGVAPAVILIHRAPQQIEAEEAPGHVDPARPIALWDRYNRSALVLCGSLPSLVVSYEDAVSQPKTVLSAVADFLDGLGVAVGDVSNAAELVERRAPVQAAPGVGPTAVEPKHVTLHQVLTQLERAPSSGSEHGVGELIGATAAFYDEDYYGDSYDQGGVPYRRDERVWVEFMSSVADAIVRTMRPATALDAGCALGMLVEALRDRGVDARGFDLSTWAIRQIPSRLQPYCWVGSMTEEIEGHYDLITCVEVLEHLPPSLADDAVANLCRHAEAVLFSSTPDDFDEPTHLNVEPSGYWSNLFLSHGFVHDLDYDATFVSPHAMLFRRGDVVVEGLVDGYERALWEKTTQVAKVQRECQELTERLAESDAVRVAHGELERDVAALRESLRNEQLRRAAENLAAFEMVREYEAGQRRMAGLLGARDAELEAVRNTKTFRYTVKARRVYERLRRLGHRAAPAPAPAGPGDPSAVPTPAGGSYQLWVTLFDTLDDTARQEIVTRLEGMAHRPTISVLMPVFNPPLGMLREAIESVQNQIYSNWELCIADDCSTDPAVGPVLDEYAAADERIKVLRRTENGHISAASNSALSLVTGEWVAPFDHDDILAEHALAMVALTLADHPEAGMVYSDEDKLDEAGHRRDPYFKPDFDPLLLLGQNCVSHLSAFRKDLVDRAGGYRVGYEGSQDWDLALRVSELIDPDQVVHIPHVLYHWRVHASSTASLVTAKPYAVEAGLRAVTDHLKRTRRPAVVSRIGQWGFNRVDWELPDPAPKVSIIVPTRDGRLLQRCIDSVLSFTMYPNFEVLVVDNSSRTLATLEYLKNCDQRVTIVRDDQPFNHSAINNLAVSRTTGDLICLLNDDTEVISGDWLSEMVSQVMQPGIGAAGAKLYYGDGRIQHAGVLLGVHGVAAHAHRGFDRLSGGYFGQLQLAHRVSAVTAACMVVRREAWNQVNGFDATSLPNVLNDVDLCLRLQEAGWGIVWTPYAELYHQESTSRGLDNEGPQAEAFARAAAYMETRWGFAGLRRDPYYNPNLTLDAEDYSLAWPPRTTPTETA